MKSAELLDLSRLRTQSLPDADPPTNEKVAERIIAFQNDAKMARNGIEEEWLECTATYLGSIEAYQWLRNNNARREVVENDWRHKIHLGKSAEIVETIQAYLIGAMFPNSQWFGFTPTRSVENKSTMQVLEIYFRSVLERAEFREATDEFLRQLITVGNSVMSLPWDEETNRPVFKTLDIFDFYVDPFAVNMNEANVVRILRKTREEIWQRVERGEYKGLKKEDIVNLNAQISSNRIDRDRINQWQGMNLPIGSSMHDYVEIMDFWGDLRLDGMILRDVHAVVVGKKLVKIETSEYEGVGKPFIFCAYKRTPISLYGQGALHSVLGQLATCDIITNQTLDNLELTINKKWGYVEDGVTDPDQMINVPGVRIPMAEQGNVWEIPSTGLDSLAYVQVDRLLGDIDKAVGLGPLISAGPGRSGERVTAAEVAATRDAGGNRLSAVHRHVEREFLLPVLRRSWLLLRKFFKGTGVARVRISDTDEHAYVQVYRSDFQIDVDFSVRGADHVVDRERDIEDITMYMNVVASNPELAQLQNWPALARKFASVMGIFDDISEIVLEPDQGPSPEQQQALAAQQQAEQAALQAANAPLPITANGVPLPGVAEELQANSPAAFPPEALNALLSVDGIEGMANLTMPPSQQIPTTNN